MKKIIILFAIIFSTFFTVSAATLKDAPTFTITNLKANSSAIQAKDLNQLELPVWGYMYDSNGYVIGYWLYDSSVKLTII